jgi:hypothetical protein
MLWFAELRAFALSMLDRRRYDRRLRPASGGREAEAPEPMADSRKSVLGSGVWFSVPWLFRFERPHWRAELVWPLSPEDDRDYVSLHGQGPVLCSSASTKIGTSSMSTTLSRFMSAQTQLQ